MSDITIKMMGEDETSIPAFESTTLIQMANSLRFLAIDAVESAHSGHPGMPMGMADIATVLFSQFLKFDPLHPHWPDRDRFVLSNGHGSMLLYALNYLTGYKGMTREQLTNFRQLGSHTPGHPEKDQSLGIETTTGPLGQGLGNAVGMALAERLLNAEFGNKAIDHFTYVFAGDGCLMEGISQEVISFAGHLRLGKLILFFDDNQITIDGPTSLSTSEDHITRFKAENWHTQTIDGHDHHAIAEAIIKAQKDPRPSMIACRTTIAYGAPHKAGTAKSHGAPLGPEEVAATRKALGWPYEPFEIPEHIKQEWTRVGQRGQATYGAWEKHFESLPGVQHNELKRRFSEELPPNWHQGLSQVIDEFLNSSTPQATRQLSQKVLEALAATIPEMIGGSADLTESNNTKTNSMQVISPENYQGRYIHYGIREHGMAAIMNGLRLHGGLIPYGGTFLVFSDYCRPAIRLASLMQIQTIFVMTHDSIGLGEDGPTHQPIEQLASLRAIPNLYVFRPADGIEVAECWQLALEQKKAPSLIALTRQKVPRVHSVKSEENQSRLGAYILQDSHVTPRIILIATGSEVSLALNVREALELQELPTRVVSMPCWRLFDEQPHTYKNHILSPQALKVSIEAGSTLGWHKYVGEKGLCVGIDTFGASAPAEDVFQHFGLTVKSILNKIQSHLKGEST